LFDLICSKKSHTNFYEYGAEGVVVDVGGAEGVVDVG